MVRKSRAEDIRGFARSHYIEPALKRGDAKVEIVAGDVHREMHLQNLVPNVCQALRGRRFLDENGLVLEKVDGPPSGLGTRVKFIYRITARSGQSGRIASDLLQLRGIAKDVFRSLGGGEAFLRQERERFYGREKER